MKYIFGSDVNRMPIKGGIFRQKADENFPEIGSSIVYRAQKNSSKIVEKVLVRNETTKTFETVSSMPYAYVTSCMVFQGKTPMQSLIRWKVDMRPKWCFGRCAKYWMQDKYEVDFRKIYANNLKAEIAKKYAEEVSNSYYQKHGAIPNKQGVLLNHVMAPALVKQDITQGPEAEDELLSISSERAE